MSRGSIDGGLIDNFLADVKAHKAERTWQIRHTDLKDFYGWFQQNDGGDLVDIEVKQIRRYLTDRSNDGLSPNTLQSRYYSISAFCNALASPALLNETERNPLEDIDLERSGIKRMIKGTMKTSNTSDEFVHVEPWEVDLLVDHAPSPKVRNQLIMRLLFQTGIRKQECRDIRLENVDTDERRIEVWAKKLDNIPDKDPWRKVEYQPSLDRLMSLWVDQYRDTYAPARRSDYLFLTDKSERVGRSRIDKVVRKAAQAVNDDPDVEDIQKVLFEDSEGRDHMRITPHAFRHGHCMHAVRNGIDIAYVSEQCGHESLETTKTYLDAISEDKRRAYNKFERS